MNRSARLPVLAAVSLAMMISTTGCEKLKARDQLNKGVASYKAGKYEEAIQHFQSASTLDPKLPAAKEYLATALSQNVVPGLDSPENLKTANQAIATFQAVLQEHPDDVNSLKGVASLYYNTKKLDTARDWQKKVLAIDPKDPEAAYTVGVIDWTQAHENLLKLTGSGNDDGQGNLKVLKDKSECAKIQQENASLVDEGLKYLNMAIENRPSYDDAMSYLNLTYRRKADVDCGNDDARKQDVASATEWSTKAMGDPQGEPGKDRCQGRRRHHDGLQRQHEVACSRWTERLPAGSLLVLCEPVLCSGFVFRVLSRRDACVQRPRRQAPYCSSEQSNGILDWVFREAWQVETRNCVQVIQRLTTGPLMTAGSSRSAVFKDLLCVVVVHLGLVVEHFRVGVLQELGMVIAQ